MRRCERRCEDEKVWRWEGVREGVKRSRCEDEKMWRWADVKMRRCERRCEDEKVWEKVWRSEGVKIRRCEDEKVWKWEGVKMRRCEDEKVWRWEGVKMRRWDTDPHYWKNPALRRSREKTMQTYMFHLVWTGSISFERHLGDFTAERAAEMTKL